MKDRSEVSFDSAAKRVHRRGPQIPQTVAKLGARSIGRAVSLPFSFAAFVYSKSLKLLIFAVCNMPSVAGMARAGL
jgi:hypothetical protein